LVTVERDIFSKITPKFSRFRWLFNQTKANGKKQQAGR